MAAKCVDFIHKVCKSISLNGWKNSPKNKNFRKKSIFWGAKIYFAHCEKTGLQILLKFWYVVNKAYGQLFLKFHQVLMQGIFSVSHQSWGFRKFSSGIFCFNFDSERRTKTSFNHTHVLSAKAPWQTLLGKSKISEKSS